MSVITLQPFLLFPLNTVYILPIKGKFGYIKGQIILGLIIELINLTGVHY